MTHGSQFDINIASIPWTKTGQFSQVTEILELE